MTLQRALSQYFTPRWVAEAIVEQHFADLPDGATAIEPSCGDGRFLMALPAHVRAIGVEIDPAWAAVARQRSGREVLTGDFLHVPLPIDVHAIVGNPPFKADVVAAFLDRAHGLLREGGKCGLILPAYVLQTSVKVLSMSQRWSMSQVLMPRNIFPRLSVPILFATFTKERERKLFGFFLYQEAADVARLAPTARAILDDGDRSATQERGRTSVWRQAVNKAFDLIDAEVVPLSALYRAIEGQRPTENVHYRQKCRQVLQQYEEFEPVDRGVWRRRTASVAASPRRFALQG